MDLYIPDLGDDLGNIFIGAHEEAHALMNIGRLTELSQYIAKATNSNCGYPDDSFVSAWDQLNIRGLSAIAFQNIPNASLPPVIAQYANVYIAMMTHEEINKDKKEQIAYATMLAAGQCYGYSPKQIAERIMSEPFCKK